MANVIHRTREEAVYDGSSGQQIDTVTYHELGIEQDGVFVPFATKQGSYVDALVARGKEAQKAEQHTPSNTSNTGEQVEQTNTTTTGEAAQATPQPGTPTTEQ